MYNVRVMATMVCDDDDDDTVIIYDNLCDSVTWGQSKSQSDTKLW